VTDKTEESNGKEEDDEISKEDTKEIVEEVYGESDVMKYLCLQQNEEKNDTKEAKEEEEEDDDNPKQISTLYNRDCIPLQ
jgi:hypothetical protein